MGYPSAVLRPWRGNSLQYSNTCPTLHLTHADILLLMPDWAWAARPLLRSYVTPRLREFLVARRISMLHSLMDCFTRSPSFEVGDKPSGDVFLSPTKPFKERRAGRSVTSPLKNDETAVQDTNDSPTRPFRVRFSSPAPRHQVGSVDAQGIYPPSACVFVAKYVLPTQRT